MLITPATLVEHGFVHEGLASSPHEWWKRDGIRVWNYNEKFWLVDALDQGGLQVRFHTIEHLDEFWRACRMPPLVTSYTSAEAAVRRNQENAAQSATDAAYPQPTDASKFL